MKLCPSFKGPFGVLESLRRLRDEVIVRNSPNPAVPLPSDEFLYIDDTGNIQFLRHTIVAGAFKFDPTHPQTLPYRLLDSFKGNLNYLTTLVCIGYGFGDDHINTIVRDWLRFSGERRLKVVNPKIERGPDFFLHLSPQVCLMPMTARDYFASLA